MNSQRTLRFPHRRSVGTLYAAPTSQPEEWELLSQVRALVVSPENQPIKWEVLDEARGAVKVPPGVKLKLKINPKGAALSSLQEMAPDDFHVLDLSHSDVTDTSLAHIQGLRGLRVLELTSTDITDQGLLHVAALTGLTSLGLSHSRISDAGLRALSGLKKLRELWLSSTQIDDEGLENLILPPSLVQLGLSGTKISDQGLKRLYGLKELIRVYLFSTKVTREGTDCLKRELPNCRVKWCPPQLHEEEFDASAGPRTTGEDEEGMLKRLSESFPVLDFSAPQKTLDDNRFWHLIELLDWESTGDDIRVIEPCVEELSCGSIEDILAFQDILSEKLYLLDGEDFAREIGQDAYAGNKASFSKEWFLGVRCCVVANGREFFEEVLATPSLIPKDMEFEVLLDIAKESYRRKTNKRLRYTPAYNFETFSNKRAWAQVEVRDTTD